MQKTLACVAMLLVGALAGCNKDQHREPAAAGYDTEPRGHSVPTKVARAEPSESEKQLAADSKWQEEPAMTPASGPTEGMTPASGTAPEDTTPQERGPIVLQFEGANDLAMALCANEQACGRVAATDELCEETVKSEVMPELGICDQGLSRAELSTCLTAIEGHSCEAGVIDRAEIDECKAAKLCAR